MRYSDTSLILPDHSATPSRRRSSPRCVPEWVLRYSDCIFWSFRFFYSSECRVPCETLRTGHFWCSCVGLEVSGLLALLSFHIPSLYLFARRRKVRFSGLRWQLSFFLSGAISLCLDYLAPVKIFTESVQPPRVTWVRSWFSIDSNWCLVLLYC